MIKSEFFRIAATGNKTIVSSGGIIHLVMKTVHALRELDLHQRGILAQIDSALPLLRLPPARAQPALAKARWQMVRLLHAYQSFKHGEIFDPAIRSGTAAQIRAASRMKADCIAAGEAFRTYVQRWSSTGVTTEWDAYVPAMVAMADQLRAHVATERRTVEALLAGAERTRRLAG